MRIAVVSSSIFPIPTPGYAGLEMIAYHCAKGLAERGHRVTVFAPLGSQVPGCEVIQCLPPGFSEEQMYGGCIWKTSAGEEMKWPGFWQRFLTDNGQPAFDVCIDHSWQCWLAGIKMEGRLGRMPILKVMHAPIPTMYQTIPPEGVISFVCISDSQKSVFDTIHSPRKALRAYNGIDLDFYRSLSIPRTNRFLFLARFSFIKGAAIALESCSKVGVGLDLVGDTQITGEPEYFNMCCNMADGVERRIIGGVPRGESVWWMSQAHAFLHPNKHFCHLPKQKVITNRGVVPIEDISAKDKVLTHDGTFSPVEKSLRRHYSGKILTIQHSSFSGRLQITPDHPLLSIKPRVCACMGESNGAICKPTYGGYDHCRELRDITIEKQAIYDSVMADHLVGIQYAKIAEKYRIPPTTAFYWTRGKTGRPSRDLNRPYCDSYVPTWVPADKIAIGDFLATPIPKSEDRETIVPKTPDGLESTKGGFRKHKKTLPFPNEIPLTPAFLSLCGWYLAEGYASGSGGARFALNRDEIDYAEEIRSQIREVFSLSSTIYQAKDSHCQIVLASGQVLGRVMKNWFGVNARDKGMPHWLFMLPPDKIKYVVRSAWRGDGCRVNSYGYESLSYTTVSPTLAMQLWLSLAKMGVVSYLVEKVMKGKAYGAGNITYNLNVRGEYAKKLAEIIGWDIQKDQSNTGWKGMTFIHNGWIYSRVNEIAEKEYNGEVHNLTIPGQNSYIAQLVSSHNCEPFGLAPIESQACGTPVVAWRFGAMPETVRHGETGWLVESEHEFTGMVREMAKGVPESMRRNCMEWAGEFSLQKMILNYENLCHRALDGEVW